MRLNFWSKYMQLVSRALINVLDVLCSEISVLSNSVTPWTAALCPSDYPGKTTVVACHALLQEIFQTQGSNLCLLQWQTRSFPLVPIGKPIGIHS